MDLLTQTPFRLLPIKHLFLPGGHTALPILEYLNVPVRRGLLRHVPTKVRPERLHGVQLLRNAHFSQWQLNFHFRHSAPGERARQPRPDLERERYRALACTEWPLHASGWALVVNIKPQRFLYSPTIIQFDQLPTDQFVD